MSRPLAQGIQRRIPPGRPAPGDDFGRWDRPLWDFGRQPGSSVLRGHTSYIYPVDTTWRRWCDRQGRVIPTGAERAEQERERADQERLWADKLAAQLRGLGVTPDEQ
jgi:hypothetical protein